MAHEPWYEIENTDRIDTPALVIYTDRVQHNIETAIGLIGDRQRLRTHVKTTKSAEAVLMLLHEGLKKFKCATIAEAEMLARVGAPDVLLAYQPVGPKAMRFISLLKNYPATTFSCLVDNWDAAAFLSQKAMEASVNIRVFIDLNTGMNRTGILPDDGAINLYASCAQLPGLHPVGLHAYDGHINDCDFARRKEKCDAAFAPVEALRAALVMKGFAEPVIVAGGSATFPIHAKRQGVECSPGTFIYWDAGYSQQLPDLPFLPAALLLTRIVSFPGENIICTDLGHKAVASEAVLSKRVQFINAPALGFISHSEEHLVLQAQENHNYKIGDLLYGIPHHVCPTVALYEKALAIKNRKVTAGWETVARARMLSF